MKKSVYRKWWFWTLLAIILVIIFNFFVATVAIVDGISMEPNFHTGEVHVVSRWQYNFGSPTRGDVVVVSLNNQRYLNRIVGLPGDRLVIKSGSVFINDKKINEPYLASGVKTYKLDSSGTPLKDQTITVTVPQGKYFVLGDNRPETIYDSRTIGEIPIKSIIGVVSKF